MTGKITKEQILTALKKGKVSYRVIGGGFMSPSKVRACLLNMADHLDDPEIDLSIAFDKAPRGSLNSETRKVAEQKVWMETHSNQNQYQ